MRIFAIVMIPALVLSGCSRVPEPATYAYSNQLKMQASHHWNVLAADLASEINKALVLSDYISAPVYVRATCGDENRPCEAQQTSVFDETFRDLLITHLVALGVPTIREPSTDSITVHYKAQSVYHHAQRWRTVRPGLLTMLTAGVIVLRNVPWEIATLATAGAIDALNSSFNSLGHYEVVITTSMFAKDKYLYRSTDIYYINDKDSWHYQTSAQAARISLTSGTKPPATPEKELLPPDEATPVPMVPEAPENMTGI